MNRLRFTLPLFLFLNAFCNGQDYPKQDLDLSQIADNLFQVQDLDLDYGTLYENLVQQLANPVNLNKATKEELQALNILSIQQIESFINYRRENGDLLSVYEMQAIDGFDLQTIYMLAPFVTVTDQSSLLNRSLLNKVLTEDNNYFISRYERTLQIKNGFKNNADPDHNFVGSQDKLYFRFRTSRAGDFSLGLTAEKDEGEKLAWNTASNQYGFDYLSFHAQIQNKGKIKNLIIGDFQNQFGQGLTLGGAFSLGKGGETITTTRKSNIGSTPHTSATESGFLRGIATTYELLRNIYITGFYSLTKRDGKIVDSTSDESVVSSFQVTGFHRNKNELATRKSITESTYGTVINYKHNSLDAGLLLNTTNFNTSINRASSIYNQYSFTGKQNTNYGAFLNYTIYNTALFSELAKNKDGGMGIIVGLISSLNNNFDVSIVYRKYDKNYYSFYSNAFAESTTPQNETGIYLGWKYKLKKSIQAAGYFDYFQFPWLRYRSYDPSFGHEWLVRLSYQPAKKITMYGQIREEKKLRNISNDTKLFTTADGIKRNYCVNIEYEVSRILSMKTRAQFSTFELSRTQTSGMALAQDFTLSLGKLKLTGRYAFIDTDDYENRQYVYERDVWLSYSLPAYYGLAIRNFMLAEYKLSKHVKVWIRYASTQYSGQNKIGSGVNAISGNTKSDVTFQLYLSL